MFTVRAKQSPSVVFAIFTVKEDAEAYITGLEYQDQMIDVYEPDFYEIEEIDETEVA